jgi:hypothetical protein
VEAVYTVIYIGRESGVVEPKFSSREYTWFERDMEVTPSFKKAGSGLRYIRQLNEQASYRYEK